MHVASETRQRREPSAEPRPRLLLAAPGPQPLVIPPDLHALDVQIDGTASDYLVAGDDGSVARSRSAANTFAFLPAGSARAVVTCRSGWAVRVLFPGPGLAGAALRPLLHVPDAPLVGAARIARNAEEPFAGAAIAETLLLRLAQIIAGTEGAPPAGPPPDVQRVLAHIERHFAERLTLADLAEAAGSSPFRLARRFRAATGESLHGYLVERRLAHAEEMIVSGRASLAEVAFASGFASQSHMTTVFRKRRGLTPGRLRRGR
jgi:AraC family transcriptional regulator